MTDVKALTDAEVICTFMQPKPSVYTQGHFTWWPWLGTISPERRPRPLTLDALREVQERLTDEQWLRYSRYWAASHPQVSGFARFLLCVSAEQKIRALAAVLR